MFTEKVANNLPLWARKCEFTTISKLLEKLSNKFATSCYAKVYRGYTYAVIVQRFSPTYAHSQYVYLSYIQWLFVIHIIRVSPSKCDCWCCKWRKKRKRYLEPHDFNHIFEPRKLQ